MKSPSYLPAVPAGSCGPSVLPLKGTSNGQRGSTQNGNAASLSSSRLGQVSEPSLPAEVRLGEGNAEELVEVQAHLQAALPLAEAMGGI